MLLKITNKLFTFQLKHLKKCELRNCLTEAGAVETKTQVEPKKKRKTDTSIKNEIQKYVYSLNRTLNDKDNIPNRFLKRNQKYPDDLYLIDAKVAKKIVSTIKPYIANDNKLVIETNPGFGHITKGLLEAGLENMHLYESTVYFRNHILNLYALYPGRLKVYNKDFFSIWSLSYQDRHDNGERVKKLLSHVEMKNWTDNVAMTIVGALATSNFIRHIMLSLIFQFGVMTYGRMELFLTLPPPLYLQLTATSESGHIVYRSSSVLFQLLFDHEILEKVPRKAYLPWDNANAIKKKSKLKHLFIQDPDNLYLTRICFKKDLPVPQNKLQHLWYFVQNMMLSRKRKIIPTLERWIPGCGISLLIKNNPKFKKENKNFPQFNIFTKSGDLTPNELLEIFIHFSSLPEYSESAFIASMETAFLKMENMSYSEPTMAEEEEQDLAEENKIESDDK